MNASGCTITNQTNQAIHCLYVSLYRCGQSRRACKHFLSVSQKACNHFIAVVNHARSNSAKSLAIICDGGGKREGVNLRYNFVLEVVEFQQPSLGKTSPNF